MSHSLSCPQYTAWHTVGLLHKYLINDWCVPKKIWVKIARRRVNNSDDQIIIVGSPIGVWNSGMHYAGLLPAPLPSPCAPARPLLGWISGSFGSSRRPWHLAGHQPIPGWFRWGSLSGKDLSAWAGQAWVRPLDWVGGTCVRLKTEVQRASPTLPSL